MQSIYRCLVLLVVCVIAAVIGLNGQSDRMTRDTFKDFAFRSIGPGLTSGRVQDVAIDPKNPSVWYVAASSGNLWKTDNRGNTFTPVFDEYGSYSLGAVVVDPKDSNVVWLGTGENANQRSVSFGDGVYKSTDAVRPARVRAMMVFMIWAVPSPIWKPSTSRRRSSISPRS